MTLGIGRFHLYVPIDHRTYQLRGRVRHFDRDEWEPWVCFTDENDLMKFIIDHTKPGETATEFAYIEEERE